ncbi:MAG TPA: cytochrome P450 [Thermoanaerobaculia bacterium]|jgi:cytochrome P450|nr:cytochrome P450 [Thermoanaerobaculia bacterium]
MAVSPGEQDILRDLRARSYAEGGIFWVGDDELAVFDPDAAQKINAANFSELILPDKLADLLRGRTGKPFYWQDIRAVWIAQMRRLSDAEGLGQLAARMSSLLDERLDRPLDLVWAAQEVSAQALVPVVVAGLSFADTARVLRDQTLKIRHLLVTEASRETLWQKFRDIRVQVGAGLVVRRELRRRANGRRPRRLDLADPIVDLLPELGMDRGVDAVTGVLTAIAGPPGAAAAALLYELTRRPDWSERLTRELAAIPPTDLYAAPTRVAPESHRFVKETLRMWSPTPLVNRTVRTEIHHEKGCLKAGQGFLLSPDILHHDPRYWKDPDTFDPDRWLADESHGSGACYVPFGWSPRGCVGAGLGTAQLILLCHLLCTRYRVQLADPDAVRMALFSVPLPRNFLGTITRRPPDAAVRPVTASVVSRLAEGDLRITR